MKRKTLAPRIVSAIAAILLVFGLMPVTALATAASGPAARIGEAAQRSDADIDAAIAQMLAQGDYVEGEAIVCYLDASAADSGFVAQPADADELLAEADPLSTVTAEQYAAATDGAEAPADADDPNPAANAPSGTLMAQAVDGDEEVAVAVVRESGMSTEALLRQLLHDPQVLSAEPNYVMQLEDADQGGDSPANEGSPIGTGATADLTGYQWFSSGAASAIPQLPDARNPGIRVPNWNDPATENAGGVVVIMDSGVDFTHPDLAGVMYRFSPELQAQLGCGEYGYAPSRADKTDVRDGRGHGTHCAGIVAAQWNGRGVSGVANGAKICAVSIAQSVEDSSYTYDAIIAAYDFAIRAAQAGVDIRAINRSMSSSPTNNADAAVIQAAGEAGIVSCIASGNNSVDFETGFDDTSVCQQSPYVLRVDASKQQDDKAWFSNYGAHITDVFAPGAGILSTIPTNLSSLWRYFPQADPDPLHQETSFDDALPTVSLGDYDGQNLQKIDFAAADIGADGDGRSIKGTVSVRLGIQSFLFIDLPVDGLDDGSVQDASVAFLGNGVGARDARLDVLLSNDEYTSLRREGENRSQNVLNSWSYAAFHVDDPSVLGEGIKRITDDQGRECIRLRLMSQFYTQSFRQGTQADVEIYLDQIAIGKAGNQALLPYQHMNGTSMAAPCVSGCAAVVSSGVQAADPAERAAQTVRILKGAVHQAEGYQGFCKQNGQVDLGLLGSTDSYAPVLETAQVVNGELTLKGAYFGQAGTLSAGGTELETTSWSDGSISAPWPSDLSSGLVSVAVAASNGTEARRAFMVDASAPSDVALYERDLAPLTLYPEGDYEIGVPNSIAATDGGSLFAASVATDGVIATATHCLLRSDDAGASWTSVALPQSLKTVSLAAGGGKLYVLGATPAVDTAATEYWHLYSMDIEQGTFEHLASYDAQEGTEVTTASALAYAAGNLFIVDCFVSYDWSSGKPSHMRVRAFDEEYTPVGRFLLEHEYQPTGFYGTPMVSVEGNSIYVCGLQGWVTPDYDNHNYCLERVDVADDGSLSSTDLSAAFDGLDGSLESSDICMVATDHGLFLVGRTLDGLLPEGAQRTDTFVMRPGTTTFAPYHRTLSYAPAYNLAGVYADGWLYAYGTSEYEETPVFGRATRAGDDHQWGETSYTWTEDLSQATAAHTCTICGHVESKTVDTTSAVTKEPTETAAGTRTYTAEFGVSWAQAQTKDVEIPKLAPVPPGPEPQPDPEPDPDPTPAPDPDPDPDNGNKGGGSGQKKGGSTTPSTADTAQVRGTVASSTPHTADPLPPFGLLALAMLAVGAVLPLLLSLLETSKDGR